jgi:hypothetical protein
MPPDLSKACRAVNKKIPPERDKKALLLFKALLPLLLHVG